MATRIQKERPAVKDCGCERCKEFGPPRTAGQRGAHTRFQNDHRRAIANLEQQLADVRKRLEQLRRELQEHCALVGERGLGREDLLVTFVESTLANFLDAKWRLRCLTEPTSALRWHAAQLGETWTDLIALPAAPALPSNVIQLFPPRR
jgi:hypothetical protein